MQHERLSIGFADLTYFVRLMEAVTAERAVEILDERLQAAGDCIVAHGGEIRKYLGDAILFTAPTAPGAVAAAREIAALPPVEVGGVSLRFRAAVATGPVVKTEIGHASRRIEDIFGQAVNQAALLLRDAANSPDAVALCPVTQAELEGEE